jgi:hypothetical protein
VLSEFKATVTAGTGAAQPVEFAAASADFAQDQFPIQAAIDGNVKTGWAIAPQFAKRHVAVFETRNNLDLAADARLTIVLDQQHGTQHTIGKFKISATTMPRPVKLEGFSSEIGTILATAVEQRTAAQNATLTSFYAPLDTELAQLTLAEAEHARQAPPFPATKAQTLAHVNPPRKTQIHIRGDFLRPGEEVDPHTPAILHPFQGRAGPSASRLDLARWLVAPGNPLTARVTMNRVWKNLFGQALVTSIDDFGTRGERPSHPDLLDWLAVELMTDSPANAVVKTGSVSSPSPPFAKGGSWSIKRMIKLIVQSATYRQSSQPRRELLEQDSRNRLLARQNRFRVEAEVLRDICLAAGGLLTPTVGGPSVHPRQPAGVSELTYAGSARWVESTGPDRYRRGLYTWFQRTSPYPMLMTFDAPESNVTCTRRDRSNTPLQALTLLNDPVFHECAQGLARRMLQDRPGDTDAALDYAFELCVGRNPNELELNNLKSLFSEFKSLAATDRDAAAKLVGLPKPAEADLVDTAAAVALARVLLNLDEMVTRE